MCSEQLNKHRTETDAKTADDDDVKGCGDCGLLLCQQQRVTTGDTFVG